MVQVQLVRAMAPRLRGVRARVGVLEDVRGAAGDGSDSDTCNGAARERLHDGGHYEDALSVREAELAMARRIRAPEAHILIVQSNLACTYNMLGRDEEALSMRRDVYSGNLKLYGEENENTPRAANNYANSLVGLKHFEEAKSLMRKTIPVARRVLGEGNESTLRTMCIYAEALSKDDGATLDDLREAVTTLEGADRTARQVLGGTHPTTVMVGRYLREARAALSARKMRICYPGYEDPSVAAAYLAS